MSAYDPGTQSSNPEQTAEVICPQCKGGNPVVARNCMWCGAALAQRSTPPLAPIRPQVAPIVKSLSSQSSTPPIQPIIENDASAHADIGTSLSERGPIRVLGFHIPQLIATIAAVLLVAGIGTFMTEHSSQSRIADLANNSQQESSQPTTNAVPAVAQDAGNPTLSEPLATATLESLATAISEPLVTVASEPLPTATMDVAGTQMAAAASAGSLPASQEYYYADATSHSVSAFAVSYTSLGGPGSIGYPLTQPFIEENATNGKWYWVQYFEKGVMEYHSDEIGENQYQLASLGVWRFSQKYPNGAPNAKAVPGKGTHKFDETNHTVGGIFLKYWQNNGQVARFGYPLSESFEEKSDADGKTYLVQYFERAEMEYHPEQKSPNDVQLTALGSMKAANLYPQGAPTGASNPLPSPTVDVVATAAAVANATATAAQAQADADATAQAQAYNATATAQTKQAEGTATALVKQAAANASATVRTLQSYVSNAPQGTFRATGTDAAISCKVEYHKCIGNFCADGNSKFVLIDVAVTNIGYGSLHVNPLNFTLVSTKGGAVAYDSNTFSLNNYLDAIDIQPDTYTSGWMAFLTTKDFIPGKLVWEEIFGETVDVNIVEP